MESAHFAEKFDKIDQRILSELETDGRLSNAELAKRVGLSASGCYRRVSELERLGIISGYKATLDRKALGKGFTVFVSVGLADHSRDALLTFEKAMLIRPEVAECHCVTGSREYLLRIHVADLDEFKIFHTDVLGAVPSVAQITSQVVMASPKGG